MENTPYLFFHIYARIWPSWSKAMVLSLIDIYLWVNSPLGKPTVGSSPTMRSIFILNLIKI